MNLMEGGIYTDELRRGAVLIGWLLLGVSALLAAAAVVLAVAGLSSPPFLLAAGAVAIGSYGAWSRAQDRLVVGVYDRAGVEPNADGTVGDAGARAERTATGRVAFEPRDDWDDPEDWPFDDPFWTDDEVEYPRWATDGNGSEYSTDTGRSRRRHRESTERTVDGGTDGGCESDAGPNDPFTSGGVRVIAPRTHEACDILGVSVDASSEELRAAYRDAVKATHPDHGGDETAFKEVRWAYEYLRSRRE